MPEVSIPKISIITPSFNHAKYLEDTINSVLSQNYPNLEYIVIDGGSTDGSLDIIKKYADRLTYWISEPDKGHGDALNKGFKRATGEIMSWLNSDDLYFPWTLSVVAGIFNDLPRLEWLTSSVKMKLTIKGSPYGIGTFYNFGKRAFFEGLYLPDCGAIPQESTFWRRSLWKNSGEYIPERQAIIPDFELWARFWQRSNLYTVQVPLGGIRVHKQQITTTMFDACCKEAKRIWCNYGGREPSLVYRYVRGLLLRLSLVRAFFEKKYTVSFDLKNGRWYFSPLLTRCRRKIFQK